MLGSHVGEGSPVTGHLSRAQTSRRQGHQRTRRPGNPSTPALTGAATGLQQATTRPAGRMANLSVSQMEVSIEAVDFGKYRGAVPHLVHLRAVRRNPVLHLALADQHVGCLLEVNLPSS